MKTGLTGVLSGFLLAFYLGILMYVFFAVNHIEKMINFSSAMIFEIIGFLLLGYLVFGKLLSKRIKTGFFVPLVAVTVIYTIILDVINLICVRTMSHEFFILLNLVLLFVYCIVSIPIYIIGKNEK